MKHIFSVFSILILIMAGVAVTGAEEFGMEYGRFGKLSIYRNSNQPSQVVLFVSGDGGWNLGVKDMARSLADLDALVVGIDLMAYFRNIKNSSEYCVYSAAEFESVSKFVQKNLGFSQYRIPVLVGYSSGATFVYAVMVQAPYNTFQGAISLGFCPKLNMQPALCQSNGLKWRKGPKQEMEIQPFTGTAKPWIVFQGADDQVCDPGVTSDFVKKTNSGKLILLPHIGHGFSVQKNWLPQFKEAFLDLTASESKGSKTPEQANTLGDLPLVEVPAKQSGKDFMAVLLTGDGGWAGLDQEVSAELARRGIPVAGLSTLKYFWTARTPDSSAKDLERIIRYCLSLWKKDKVVLIGYSFGADVLPFMVSRLPQDLSSKTALVVLLGPSSRANFEFHLSDWLGGAENKGLPTLPEIKKLSGTKILCLYGNEDAECICPQISQSGATSEMMSGAHHFDGNYTAVVDKILAELGQQNK
ncbi:MAG TPA: AcvB/VirJ family lysyl-phosphatidylglycerol hydrolase [Smithellaceae bacterium]|nr:AcvB/VirJ family lysyl-phosphatidylglycerol hydrolase [Smithellaceae bacterium]